jgi:hypothetical protein
MQGQATLLRVASHLPASKTLSLYENFVLPAFSALGESEGCDEEDEEDNETKKTRKGTDGTLCYALMACLYKWDHADEVCSFYLYIIF